MSKVYVLTDSSGRIIEIEGEYSLPSDLTGWVQIDEGDGAKYSHAQSQYLEKPLYTDDGIPRYKLSGGNVVERSAAEIAEDVAAIPPPPPTAIEIVQEDITNCMLALTEVYEEAIVESDAQYNSDNDIMLALTELYEMIITLM